MKTSFGKGGMGVKMSIEAQKFEATKQMFLTCGSTLFIGHWCAGIRLAGRVAPR